jgi:hypothetical protein
MYTETNGWYRCVYFYYIFYHEIYHQKNNYSLTYFIDKPKKKNYFQNTAHKKVWVGCDSVNRHFFFCLMHGIYNVSHTPVAPQANVKPFHTIGLLTSAQPVHCPIIYPNALRAEQELEKLLDFEWLHPYSL